MSETPKKRGRGRPFLPRRVEDYKAIGSRPNDPLKVNEWMQQGIAVAFETVMHDERMSEEQRRREMRQLAKTHIQLTPAERLYRAEQAVKKHRELLEEDDPDPGLTDVEQEGSLRLNPR